jgi:hypothetical protein
MRWRRGSLPLRCRGFQESRLTTLPRRAEPGEGPGSSYRAKAGAAPLSQRRMMTMTDQSPVTDLLHKMLDAQAMVQCEWCKSLHQPTQWGYKPRNLHFCCKDHMTKFAEWRWTEPDRERD